MTTTQASTTAVVPSFRPEETDWTPWLTAAPEIIRDLGICTAITSTRQIACIRLQTEGTVLRTNDIPSNLVRVSNDGQKAFLGVCSALKKISQMTESMSEPDGLLDELAETFSDPNEQDFATMIIEQMQDYLSSCNEQSQTSQAKFEELSDLIGHLSEAIHLVRANVNRDIVNTSSAIAETEKTRYVDKIQLAVQEQEKAQAEAQVNKMLGFYEKRHDNFDAVAGFSMASAVVGGVPGIITGAIGTAIFGGMLSAAASDLEKTEEILALKRRNFADTSIKLARLDGQLRSLDSSKKTLENTDRTIQGALEVLNELSSEISSLLKYFVYLTSSMVFMIKEHEWTKRPIERVQKAIADGEPPSQAMQKSVKRRITKIKKEAIRINALSNIYALVIAEVVNPAWGLARKPSPGCTDTEIEDVIRQKREDLKTYVERATVVCGEAAEAARRDLVKRLAVADQTEA